MVYPLVTVSIHAGCAGVVAAGSLLTLQTLATWSRVPARPQSESSYNLAVIFKAVGEGRPYPVHDRVSPRDWRDITPRMVRLDELITTKRTLDLGALLSEDSTFYGDIFAHVVQWNGDLYLEDGLHRALRAALQQRPVLHARVLVL